MKKWSAIWKNEEKLSLISVFRTDFSFQLLEYSKTSKFLLSDLPIYRYIVHNIYSFTLNYFNMKNCVIFVWKNYFSGSLNSLPQKVFFKFISYNLLLKKNKNKDLSCMSAFSRSKQKNIRTWKGYAKTYILQKWTLTYGTQFYRISTKCAKYLS